MFNISFFQILIVLVLVFLLFGDSNKLYQNFKKIKNYLIAKNNSNNTKI